MEAVTSPLCSCRYRLRRKDLFRTVKRSTKRNLGLLQINGPLRHSDRFASLDEFAIADVHRRPLVEAGRLDVEQ